MIYIKGDYAGIKDTFSKASIVCIYHHNVLASVGKYGKCEVGGEKLDLYLLTACWQQLRKTFAECFKSFLINCWDCLCTAYKTRSDRGSPKWERMLQGRAVFVCICWVSVRMKRKQPGCWALKSGPEILQATEWFLQRKWRLTFDNVKRAEASDRGWKCMSGWTRCPHCEWGAQLDARRSAAADGVFPSGHRLATMAAVQVWSKLCQSLWKEANQPWIKGFNDYLFV